MEPLVRPARADDAAVLAAIYAHYVLHTTTTFELKAPSVDLMRDRWSKIDETGLPYLVAEAAGEVIGYAYAVPYRMRPAYRYTVENTIYVAQEQVRRGVGRMLLQKVIDRCREMGRRQMVAVIGDSGNVASKGLHASLGFREVGVLERVGFKFDRWVDTVVMQREL